jgi:hypothetical protein
MNDIFKLFKKRAQSGKSTNITDVIKDLNEKEQNEIIGSEVGRFERGNKSYLSISKSGRLKSKKSQSSRVLQEDLFNPVTSKLAEISMMENNANNNYNKNVNINMSNSYNNNNNNNNININSNRHLLLQKSSADQHSRTHPQKPIYDPNSDNADSRASSTSSSFRSSYENILQQSPQQQFHKELNSKSQITKKPVASSTSANNYYQINNTNRNILINNNSNNNNINNNNLRYASGNANGMNGPGNSMNNINSSANLFKRF